MNRHENIYVYGGPDKVNAYRIVGIDPAKKNLYSGCRLDGEAHHWHSEHNAQCQRESCVTNEFSIQRPQGSLRHHNQGQSWGDRLQQP